MQTITTPILVTGATGFLGSHTVLHLINAGYNVRGTVRSLANKQKNQFLFDLAGDKKDNLELVEADLTKAEGWDAACKGVEYALHTASPIAQPGYTDQQYVDEALAGVDNFFNAALKEGVKKVVFTSSVAAIYYGNYGKTMNEELWSPVDGCKGYQLSKLKAELRVWEIAKENKGKIEVATVQPGGIFGPALSNLQRTSLMMFMAFMMDYPGIVEGDGPLSIIDVRDLADIHTKALFSKESDGQRYMGVNDKWKTSEILEFLEKTYGDRGFTFPKKTLTLEEAIATKNPVVGYFAQLAGKDYSIDNSKIVNKLGMKLRDSKQTIKDTVEGLMKIGLLPEKRN